MQSQCHRKALTRKYQTPISTLGLMSRNDESKEKSDKL
jgi:hypothetical protein